MYAKLCLEKQGWKGTLISICGGGPSCVFHLLDLKYSVTPTEYSHGPLAAAAFSEANTSPKFFIVLG